MATIYANNPAISMQLRLQDSFYAIENHFSQGISLKQKELTSGVAYIAGIDEPKWNVFLQREPHAQPELVINDAKDYFAKNNISYWMYIVPNNIDTPELQSALQLHNFEFDETSTAMHCQIGAIPDAQVEPKIPLIIQSAQANKTGWIKVLQAAYGGSDLANAQYAQALDHASTKGVDMLHFLGSLDGDPVAAITLTFLNDGVRIDNVATAPTHQRLGYGSQMVQFALNLSHVKEFNHCFLDASPKGKGLYQRLGFFELFDYQIYKTVVTD